MPLFADLDRLKAELDALRPLAPEQEQRVLQKFRLDWNYHSNAIEGNSLTLGETRSLLLHGLTAEGKPLRDHLDIKGHDEAVRGLEEIVHDDRPLTEQFIREMHQVLLGDEHYKPAYTASGQPTRQRIVPGQYKTSSNNVRTATGETFYFASPEETPARMNDLLIWYRQEVEAPTLHPVALAAEFHYRFVSIHPFDDGNGRMSRLLMNLILMRHGYPITVIKADETTRNRYLAALSEADAGEPEPFLRFIIENVEASLRLMIRAAQGESIDEPSDLDKKLALLKKQVFSREDTIEMAWDLVVQTRTWDVLLKPWIIDLSNQITRFDEFFLGKQVEFLYPEMVDNTVFFGQQHSKSTSYFTTNDKTLEGSILLADKKLIDSQKLYTDVYFQFSWLEFRLPKCIFNLSLSVKFIFERHKYEVAYLIHETESKKSNTKEMIFTSIYKKEYDFDYISEINYRLANEVYDFIAAKLAEADTPPA